MASSVKVIEPCVWSVAVEVHHPFPRLQSARSVALPSSDSVNWYLAGSPGRTTPILSSGDCNSTRRHDPLGIVSSARGAVLPAANRTEMVNALMPRDDPIAFISVRVDPAEFL